jgi:hypothetical protein
VVICAPTTSALGAASCATKSTRNTEYQWKFGGAGNQGHARSTSYLIKVQPRITAKASTTTVSRGASFTLAGSVAPRHARQRVYLQRYSRGAWRNVTSRLLSSTSAYAFRLSPTTTFSYRVYKRADSDHSWGKSPLRRVTVR